MTDPSATCAAATASPHRVKRMRAVRRVTELKLQKGNSSEQTTGIYLFTKFMNFPQSKLIGDTAYKGLVNVN